MATPSANDNFETYFFEKLWAMIPDVYRYQDGLDSNPNPNVLRSFIQILANQAAILRRSNDRLWEDQFIDFCDDWAVPYIGKLVGTRLISAQNTRGRRIDVAKTIYYRRRKGTPRILEQLIDDITGWDGKLVENFKRLVRARHGLDPQPAPLAGRLTGTMPGGIADLRQPSGSELVDSPFDEYFHTPDMRLHNGLQGLYGIPKLSFFLYRLSVYPLKGGVPFQISGTDRYTFDPSGRYIQLFSIRSMDSYNWDQWQSPDEWELPGPIRCRLLSEARYELTDENIADLMALTDVAPAFTSANNSDLQSIAGYEFANESEFYQGLQTLSSFTGIAKTDPRYFALLRYTIVEDCGKSQLLPDGIPLDQTPPDAISLSVIAVTPDGTNKNTVTAEYIVAANLQQNAVTLTDKKLAIDPKYGICQFQTAPIAPVQPLVSYYYAFSGDIGAGTYQRTNLQNFPLVVPVTGGGALTLPANAVLVIGDNLNYGSITLPATLKTNATSYIQSADQTRPYIVLTSNLDFIADNTDSTNLVLDGLWIGTGGGSTYNIILEGNFNCVTIRNCTLDPGGGNNASGQSLNPVSLIIQDKSAAQLSSITQICIENCILGPITILTNGVEYISVCNSIIQSAGIAITMPEGNIKIQSSTVFGQTIVEKLQASDSIFTDVVTVTDTQDGCFRFSAAPQLSRLPRPYQSDLYTDTGDVDSWFNSMQFGQPDYAQLSDAAPAQLTSGAENELEMGAFNSLNNPIKLQGLQAKVDEYMPFGLIPAFINET